MANQKTSDNIPGQRNLFSYLCEIGRVDHAMEHIQQETQVSLFCFHIQKHIYTPNNVPNGYQVQGGDDIFYHVRKPDDDRIFRIPKYKKEQEEIVKIFVLTEKNTNYQIGDYCIGNRFAEVATVNRLIRRLDALPSKVSLVKSSKEFTPDVFLKAFSYCGIIVDTNPTTDIPVLAKKLKVALASITTDYSAIISNAESDHNGTGIADGLPLSLWNERKFFLKKVPNYLYDHTEQYTAKALFNYHIQVRGHYYSIPAVVCDEYRSAGKTFTVTVTDKTVEICDGQGIIFCVHSNDEGKPYPYTTDCTHMPQPDEVPYDNYNGYRFRAWARHYGPHVVALVNYYLSCGRCEMQGYIPCMSMLNLSSKYAAVLDQACMEALAISQKLHIYPSLRIVQDSCKKHINPINGQ